MNVKNQNLHRLDLKKERNSQSDRFNIDEYLKKYKNLMPEYNCQGERINDIQTPEPNISTHKNPSNSSILPVIAIIALFFCCE